MGPPRTLTKGVRRRAGAEIPGSAGQTRAGFEASTEINRSDWGLSFNMTLDTGGVLVSEKIKIELDVQLIPAD